MTARFSKISRSSIQTATLLLAMLFVLPGCSSFDGMFDSFTFGTEGEEELANSAVILADEGMDAFNVGDYNKALKAFNAILDQHPFSPQAMLAELKAADAHYYNKAYLEAKLLYQEFEERHPTNEAIAYVMFQIGMCDFTRTDRIDRDISGAQDAIKSFSRLLRTFPNSPYSKEAKARILAARDFLVNHEYYVAVFYVRSEKFDQAEHRLKYILAMYPDSTIAPKAQELLIHLEAGDPPTWGINKWLPDLSMPNWTFWDSAEETTSEKNKTGSLSP